MNLYLIQRMNGADWDEYGLAGLAIYAADATHSYGWTPGLAVACVGGFIGSVVCVLAAILAREESGL
jgi:hypothetical protein